MDQVARHAARAIARAVLVLVAIAMALVVVGLGRPGLDVVGNILPADCTVGLAGAAVSIEVSGIGAGARCDELRTMTTDGGSWYRYEGGTAPGGAVICQDSRGWRTYTVRDQGVLNLYGTSVCSNLAIVEGG